MRLRILVSMAALIGCSTLGCSTNEVHHYVESDDGGMVSTTLTYAPDEYETVAGRVARLALLQELEHSNFGVRAILATREGPVHAYLGPERYMELKGLQLHANDTVEVRGSLIEERGQRVMIASEISSPAVTVRLRERDGTPLWGFWLRS